MHYNGGPGCSADCDARHLDDAPAGMPDCCPDCGGNAYRCFPVCGERSRNRRFEPWEGLTGDQEYAVTLW